MTIHIEPLPTERYESYSVRRCQIKRIDNQDLVEQCELWFQLDGTIPLPHETDCDAYLLSVILDAMRENRDIKIKGSVSKELLSNLVEFQSVWNNWRPHTYNKINMQVDENRKSSKIESGAICAFSGGVDATFSVWMHSQNRNSFRSQRINLCSIVHGFDIPLSDEEAYDNAKKSAQGTLHDLAIDLSPAKTNIRQISRVDWGDLHAAALVATLSNFKKLAGTCIIGSSSPYNSLTIPWGSTPITDHLLGSCDFQVMHDGASHDRTEKVKAISEWRKGSQNLRVCWQGALKDRNCGKCEKCIRTTLNFLAAGLAIPSCIPSFDILKEIHKIKLTSEGVRQEWEQIYTYAKRHNIEDRWVTAVGNAVKRAERRNLWISILIPKDGKVRMAAKKVKNTAKKIRHNVIKYIV